MTRTITIFFDTSDPSNLGYAAQVDIPGRPGVADEPGAMSLGSDGAARRCASGAKPPVRVQRAARTVLGLGNARITWGRLPTGDGWRGTSGAGPAGVMFVTGTHGFVVNTAGGIPYADDLGGGVYRLSPRGERVVMWSRDPSRQCAIFAANHTAGMGEWRT